MKKMINTITWLWIFIMAGISSPLVRAEAPAANEAILSEIEQLESLRERDVERYREAVYAKREKLKSRMGELGERRQERFQAFLGKERQIREGRLRYFRESHPRAFDRFMERRMGRLHHLAQRNPERFQRFAENHPRFKERYEGELRRRRLAAGEEMKHGEPSRPRPIERRIQEPREGGSFHGTRHWGDRRPSGQLEPGPLAREWGERKHAPERSDRGGPRRRR